MILFGHPTGNPNSHHAALGHFESGRLLAFCVPWMPTVRTVQLLRLIPQMRQNTERLERRVFTPLASAPLIQGRAGEWIRMLRRIAGARWSGEHLAYEANDWLMHTMARHSRLTSVTAVHSYEDCSLAQFESARRLGKACIYDMPIGYYPWWQAKQADLARIYSDWLPPGGMECSRLARPAQKRREMELADLVLSPSTFVDKTIREFHPDKRIARASYGVDLQFWHPPENPRLGPLRFLYAGQVGIRKGIPILLEAWRNADLKDAELFLVGTWKLANSRLTALPKGVTYLGPKSRVELREYLQKSDAFVFPSFFEGLALALLEAMACGLPIIATEVVEGMELITHSTGRSVKAGDMEALVAALRWFSMNRGALPAMKRAARVAAEQFTWMQYRQAVNHAVAAFV